MTCLLFFVQHFQRIFIQLRARGLIPSIRLFYQSLRRDAYGIFLSLPFVQSKVDVEVSSAVSKVAAKLLPSESENLPRFTKLPVEGWNDEDVLAAVERLEGMKHTRWEDGRVSGAVYHGGTELKGLQTRVYEKFAVANPIHPDVFPAVRKMEAEIVAMVSVYYFLSHMLPISTFIAKHALISSSLFTGPFSIQRSTRCCRHNH